MLKISKKTALVAFIVSMCSSNIVNAYMKYAAVYYNPETNKIIRVGGDVHGMYLPGGDKYDKQSYENIKNALKITKFKPFWVSETHHLVLQQNKIDSESMSTLDLLTIANLLNKQEYKNKTTVIKKNQNLFSQKDFVISMSNNFKSFSPIATDLRAPFVHNFMLSLLMPMHAGGQEIISGFFKNISREEEEKIGPGIQSDIEKIVLMNNRNVKPTSTPFYESGVGGYFCKYFKYDFIEYKRRCLLEFPKHLNLESIKAINFEVIKSLLDKAGNQLVTTEMILKNTKNKGMIKVLKETYNDLTKKLLLAKDSLLMQFIEGASLDALDQTKLEEQIINFTDGAFIDLPDFGFFAHIAKLSAFTNNTVLYAGYNHITGVEDLLKRSGFACIWSKHNTTLGESLSQEDCEKFFSVQPEKKVETKVEEEFFVKSKL